MYNKIVLPIEKQTDVEVLFYYAANFLNEGGTIVPVHIIDTKKAPEVTKRWRKSVDIVIPTYNLGAELNINVEPHIRSAKTVPDGVIEIVEEVSGDSILMLLKSVKYNNKLFFSTIIDSIIRYSKVDVLVANRLAVISKQKKNNLLIPYFGDSPPEKLVDFAKKYTENIKSKVTFIRLSLKKTAYDDGKRKFLLNGMKFFAKNIIMAPYSIINVKNIATVILEEAKKENYGTILLSDEIFSGKYVLSHVKILDYLAKRSPCPILFVKL